MIDGRLLDVDNDVFIDGFTGRCSFTPFYETVEQINTDIANGFPYHTGDVAAHMTDRGADFKLFGRRCSVAILLLRGGPVSRWMRHRNVLSLQSWSRSTGR